MYNNLNVKVFGLILVFIIAFQVEKDRFSTDGFKSNNIEIKSEYKLKANPIIIMKVNIKLFEKKLPRKMRMRVEKGNETPSSLKVLANVGTTKANINTPMTIIADIITPG